MKPGYGSSKGKKKSKRKQQKNNADDGDVSMRVADDSNAQQPHVSAAELSAKEKLKDRLEQKKALKLKVQSLKHNRSKLTKLPVGNSRRREYSQLIKQAVEDFTSTSKQAAQQTEAAAAAGDAAAPVAAAAGAGDSMME